MKFGRKTWFSKLDATYEFNNALTILDGDKRLVFFTENFHKFAWSAPNTKKIKQEFYLKDIVEIRQGKTTEVFKRFKKADPRFCFSILLKDRTIDLECENDRNFKALAVGFTFMNKIYKKFIDNLFLFESLSDGDFDEDVFDKLEEHMEKREQQVQLRKLKIEQKERELNRMARQVNNNQIGPN